MSESATGWGWAERARAVQSPAEAIRFAREAKAVPVIQGAADLPVGFLSTHSFQFVEPWLVVHGIRSDLRIRPYFGAFGQLEQELLAGEGLAASGSRFVVLAARLEDLDPNAFTRFYASDGKAFRDLAWSAVDRLAHCARLARQRLDGSILVANFARPPRLPLGPLDANASLGVAEALSDVNRRLREAISSVPGAVIWDYAGLVSEEGAESWTDPRLWALARIAVANQHQPSLAKHLVRTLRATCRPMAKCLVLDLDNTIWGGVIGDDGLAGVQLGDDFPGNVFKNFQRAVLSLRDRGVLLAVASKNDETVIRAAFAEHPEMLLRWEDLAAVRINWGPKSANIREMAKELNIGPDSMVLFDDNPVERAEVRSAAPEVQVIEVPSSPVGYEQVLAGSALFDQPAFSLEDRARADMYLAERERQTLSHQSDSVESFLGTLEMRADVGEVDAGTMQRVAQLIAKTNQFNLTTRRHSLGDLEEFRRSPLITVVWLRLADRFGDQGLVAVGILRYEAELALIDTLLMSCRVMNRFVENALVALLAEQARSRGYSALIGEYFPTAKNKVVEGFFERLGFLPVGPVAGGSRYRRELLVDPPAWPTLIARPG